MKTEIKLLLRIYSAEIRDERTGKTANDAYTRTAFPALNEIHGPTETNIGIELGGEIG